MPSKRGGGTLLRLSFPPSDRCFFSATLGIASMASRLSRPTRHVETSRDPIGGEWLRLSRETARNEFRASSLKCGQLGSDDNPDKMQPGSYQRALKERRGLRRSINSISLSSPIPRFRISPRSGRYVQTRNWNRIFLGEREAIPSSGASSFHLSKRLRT
jgi:hypothetical protein